MRPALRNKIANSVGTDSSATMRVDIASPSSYTRGNMSLMSGPPMEFNVYTSTEVHVDDTDRILEAMSISAVAEH